MKYLVAYQYTIFYALSNTYMSEMRKQIVETAFSVTEKWLQEFEKKKAADIGNPKSIKVEVFAVSPLLNGD